MLTNRVHPTRDTVSPNCIRRQFARLTADSIPIFRFNRETSWFSGYGDNLNNELTASVDLKQDALFSFNTWYRIEYVNDYGAVEISTDGIEWREIGKTMTGSSVSWVEKSWKVPQDTSFIRFRYHTNSSANGRGWYVNNLRLSLPNGEEISPKWKSDHWIQRND